MSIMNFGNNSFIAVKGLKERVIEAERKDLKMRPYRGKPIDPIDGKDFVYGWLFKPYNAGWKFYIVVGHLEHNKPTYTLTEVIPETVGQFTGLCYEGDYVVMDCWNGGDGIHEESIHDIFEGVVIYDKKICRFGLQTKLCDKGQIEVGLEDNRFTEIEVIGNIHQNPELMEQDNGCK